MQALTQSILVWHGETARDLPWRGETDPYRIYVSEIMLQQTRTATVRRYYDRFLAAFPTPAALSEASDDLVGKMWEGLGYYARARNLQKAARLVTEQFGGRFPSSRQALLALPGCGEYVSAAVASIAFGQRELALDGNGVRVLSRICGEAGDVTLPAVRRRLVLFGESLLPESGAGEFNQALMGMGNLVCLPKKALCHSCPAALWCKARMAGNALELPVKPKAAAKKEEHRLVAIITDGRYALVRRRTENLLRGLYEFVNLPCESGDLPQEVLRGAGFPWERIASCRNHEHVFTHRIWHMRGALVWATPLPRSDFFPVSAEELTLLPMPSAMAPFRDAALEVMAETEA